MKYLRFMNYDRMALAKCFESEIIEKFSFLVDRYGFSHTYGQFNYETKDLDPVNYEKLPGILSLSHRYAKDEIVIEITYGDRELYLESFLWTKKVKNKCSLFELLVANNIEGSLKISGSPFVLSDDFMRNNVVRMAESIAEHIDIIMNPSEEVLDRVQVIRGKRLIYDLEKQKKNDMEKAIYMADIQFKKKNYKEVISLLSGFEEALPPSQVKKILLSKKYDSFFRKLLSVFKKT